MGNVNKVIYDNTFSISLIMLKKILIKAILELIATYMEVFKGQGNDTDTSEEFEKYLQDQGMLHSFSRKGNPYDNACIESFHSLIKREWLNRFKIQNYQQAYLLVFEYINTFYNTVRIHSHCNYMSPDDYEKLYADFQKHNMRLGI